MTEIPTRRWVATRDSARQAARAYFTLLLQRARRVWVVVVVAELGFASYFGLHIDERYGAATRVFWGLVFAVAPTLVGAGLGLGVVYLLIRFIFRRPLREGIWLETGIADGVLVLRGPLREDELSFDAVASVRSSGNWVFLRLTGGPPPFTAWPAALFHPVDLSRLEHSVETRKVVAARAS